MLLTITYTGENAPDLGYLLHKHPSRIQWFQLAFGKAYVFYPEVSPSRCTLALLLDIDPLDLARGKLGSRAGGLFDYVNDRPYIVSSFMSVAISRVLGTAMAGRCEKRQDLADMPLDLSVSLTMLPCRGDPGLLSELFEPLGYGVHFTTQDFDEQFPEWGQGPYVDLNIRGKQRLQDLLRHLYVLIPVFDHRKHYYMGKDEVDKLLSHGEGWLEQHPRRDIIARRYFYKLSRFTRIALDRLSRDPLDRGEEASGVSEGAPFGNRGAIPPMYDPGDPLFLPLLNLNTRRLKAVLGVLKAQGAASVIDLGCGEGNLLQLLMKDRGFTRIAGTDVSPGTLARAMKQLKVDTLPEAQKNRITLFQGSLMYRDPRFAGYDAAAVVEVIEHIDQNRLSSFERVLFGEAKPRIVLITTPNREYNRNYPWINPGGFRHGDHRFEWTREEFHRWGDRIAIQYGYRVGYEDIGDQDESLGAPTQMGVFTRCG